MVVTTSSSTWESVRNAASWTSPQTKWRRHSGTGAQHSVFNNSCRWFYKLKLWEILLHPALSVFSTALVFRTNFPASLIFLLLLFPFPDFDLAAGIATNKIEGERERENINHTFTVSFSQWLQNQVWARILGLPQETGALVCCPPGVLSGSWIRKQSTWRLDQYSGIWCCACCSPLPGSLLYLAFLS